MAKKNRQGNDHPDPAAAALRRGRIIGGVVGGAGLLLTYFAGRIEQAGGPDWLFMVGIIAAVVGIMIAFSGGVTRESALEWIKSLGIALGLALAIRWGVAEPFRIPSGSMEPTLHGDDRPMRGDRVFVNKWIYGVRWPFMNKRLWHGHAPERWDIVVFKTVEEDARHKTLVKRIVGMPGEHIQIRDGKVVADGKPLELPPGMPENQYYTSGSGFDPMMRYGVRPEVEYARVPEGHYLLLGDNSAQSRDGRYFGWVPNEHLVGRVASIWWPPQRWRDFTGFSKTLWWRGLLVLVGLLVLARLFVGRSWPVHAHGAKGVDHLYVSFVALGLRLPMTNQWLTRWGKPARGDVVLYHPRAEDVPAGVLLAARVAGLPGEKVAIDDGRLTIDGAPLENAGPLSEPQFATSQPNAPYARSRSKQHSLVPEGHYFLLADDTPADEPLDSRAFGWIAEKDLLGKAARVWWPPRRWRRL